MNTRLVRGALTSCQALLLLAVLVAAPMGGHSSPWLSTSVVEAGDCTVYVTRSGHSYHRAGCSYLHQSSIRTTRSEAIARGYAPCKRCGGSDCESQGVVGSKSDTLRPPGEGGASQAGECTVYVTKSGARYHKPNCSSLHGSGTPMSRSAARAKGLTPCKHCGGSDCER